MLIDLIWGVQFRWFIVVVRLAFFPDLAINVYAETRGRSPSISLSKD
ncbi:hypothetical protein [Baaleninema sp.]